MSVSESGLLVLTRPRRQTAEWIERLAVHGVAAASLPLIEITPADGRAAREAWAALPAAALAVFVSPNAVEHFFAQRPSGARWPATALAACVGPGSAKALVEAGVPAGLVVQPPPDAVSLDSEHLWPRLEDRDWQHRQVLLLRGNGGREWLAERLRERGARVQAFGVYCRGTPHFDAGEQALFAAALSEPQRHVWLFSSAEGVGHLPALAPAGQRWSAARAICTHERIAEAARQLGVGHVVLARPDAAAVARAFQALQRGDLQSFSP